jgi:hypothetical protein
MYNLFTSRKKAELVAPPQELQSDKAIQTKCYPIQTANTVREIKLFEFFFGATD